MWCMRPVVAIVFVRLKLTAMPTKATFSLCPFSSGGSCPLDHLFLGCSKLRSHHFSKESSLAAVNTSIEQYLADAAKASGRRNAES